MLAPRKLKPGQPGTKKPLACGTRLLCVRRRCTPARQAIIRTIEIIVEKSTRQSRQRRLKAEQLVALRIGWKGYDLHRHGKQAGARWNPAERLWELRYDQVVRLGLTERIVKKVTSTGKSKVSSTGN